MATPSPATTIAELEQAIRAFPNLEVRQLDNMVVLVTAFRDWEKPTADELARAMFGPDNDAVLVTETGARKIIDEDSLPVG
jgi:hypothetical protein